MRQEGRRPVAASLLGSTPVRPCPRTGIPRAASRIIVKLLFVSGVATRPGQAALVQPLYRTERRAMAR